jgi:hypothetical protein
MHSALEAMEEQQDQKTKGILAKAVEKTKMVSANIMNKISMVVKHLSDAARSKAIKIKEHAKAHPYQTAIAAVAAVAIATAAVYAGGKILESLNENNVEKVRADLRKNFDDAKLHIRAKRSDKPKMTIEMPKGGWDEPKIISFFRDAADALKKFGDAVKMTLGVVGRIAINPFNWDKFGKKTANAGVPLLLHGRTIAHKALGFVLVAIGANMVRFIILLWAYAITRLISVIKSVFRAVFGSSKAAFDESELNPA